MRKENEEYDSSSPLYKRSKTSKNNVKNSYQTNNDNNPYSEKEKLLNTTTIIQKATKVDKNNNTNKNDCNINVENEKQNSNTPPSQHSESSQQSSNQSTGPLSLLTFGIMLFLLTSAGPYGLETCVITGGVCLTIIGICIVPFLYSVPQSLMVAELSSMMPTNHGYIVWVYRAFMNESYGELLGFINSLSCVAGTAVDMPVYIVLMYQYFETLVNEQSNYSLSIFQEYSFKFLFIWLSCLLNILNISILGTMSVIFTIIILLPFVIGWGIRLPETNFEVWVRGSPDGNYNYSVFIATLLWLHTGWDSMGCLAGEVGFDRKRFFWAFVIAILLDWLGYMIPLWAALTLPYSSDDWYNGYFLKAYDEIFNGFGYVVIVGGLVANFAMYTVELSAHGRSVWALSQPSIVILSNGQLLLEHLDEDILSKKEEQQLDSIAHHTAEEKHLRHIRVDILPEWFVGRIWHRTGSPAFAIILQSIICCVLVTFDFDVLVECVIFVKCFAWLCEFFAFVKLRYTEPNVSRPFKVPGGIAGAWFITITKVFVISIVFITGILEEYHIFFAAIAFNIIVIFWYFIRKRQWKQNEKAYKHLINEDNEKSSSNDQAKNKKNDNDDNSNNINANVNKNTNEPCNTSNANQATKNDDDNNNVDNKKNDDNQNDDVKHKDANNNADNNI